MIGRCDVSSANAFTLALSGLRRGEVAGLRWSDVDFDAKTLAIANNRVLAGGRTVENDRSRRLPLPERLVKRAAVGEGAAGR